MCDVAGLWLSQLLLQDAERVASFTTRGWQVKVPYQRAM